MEKVDKTDENSLTPLLDSHFPWNYVENQHEIASSHEVSSRESNKNTKFDVLDYLTTETKKKYRLNTSSHAMDLNNDL